ncbi:MAG: hypothetical protein HZB71_12650 [Betaproteobacteria bacterium]|nr:hypothetical protein [Betaproteobacteria bacterium]
MTALRPFSRWLTGLALGFLSGISGAATDLSELPAEAAALYRMAQGGRWYAQAERLQPQILPTSSGQGFLVVWKPAGSAPKRWIVSLHGSQGFATDDLAIWHPHLQDREVGVVSLQWWNGHDDSTRSYLPPHLIYREIDRTLQQLGVQPGMAMLHGFSRGAANSYAVLALDRGRGRRYFSLAVASSGGVGIDFPPNREIVAGRYGQRPLEGSRWVTVAGGRDSNAQRDGIPGMRRAADWLREQGAVVVESIEDAQGGHGALVTNAANARRVLDRFLNERP